MENSGLKEERELTKEKLLEENHRLSAALQELSVLNEIATTISSARDLESIIELIVKKCIKHIEVEQCVVTLLNDNTNNDKAFRTLVRKSDDSNHPLQYRLNDEVTGWMLRNKKPLLNNNLAESKEISELLKAECKIRNFITVPLLLKGNLTGILTVFNKKNNSFFDAEDQRLLTIIAAQSAHVIENARLLKEEKAYISVKEELRMAREIQLKLLPNKNPQIKGYDIAGINIPAEEVGGDYYDFISLPEDKLAFCLGDISGKGLPASLLMSNLQATLRGQAVVNSEAEKCIGFSNTLLYRSTDSNKFATLFYGILDSNSGTITYCNAGHDSPFHFTKSEINRLEEGGLVLGFMENTGYDSKEIKIEKGDVIVIFSDGITEAMNDKEEELGEENLLNILKSSLSNPASDIIKIILEAINNHAGGFPQYDDMTLIIIKRTS